MKKKLWLENLKDTIGKILKQSLIFVGAVVTFQEMLTGLFYSVISNMDIVKTKSDIDLFMYVILILGLIYIVVHSVFEVFKREIVIKIKTKQEQKIIIKIGNYEENMEDILNRIEETDNRAIFVIGINDEINMVKAEGRGVHKSVIKKFYITKEQENILQSRVNQAFGIDTIDNRASEIQSNEKKEFGEVCLVPHNKKSEIMFVVNSKFGSDQNSHILGPQPTDIMEGIFNTLRKRKVDVVQMPVLSSSNVKTSEEKAILFSVTIAEVVAKYFKEIINNEITYDLILSIRKEDLDKNLITKNSIIKFIEEIKPMYHIK